MERNGMEPIRTRTNFLISLFMVIVLILYVTLPHLRSKETRGHIPSQPGHYNDITLCRGHYNDIARESNPLIYPLIRRLNYYKTSILYIVDLISFTSGIEYFTFQQSF